ncbi:MAG TPA: LLM class flavin-dependent oxidoreductase [Candidatus Acidoferrum sp.]|nr:LLM class flavin-dependent oxidoreductase [Candidatus Acidoferrum sp.]
MLSSKESLPSGIPFKTEGSTSRMNNVAPHRAKRPVDLFSTCPQSFGFEDQESYARQVRKVARWSEQSGCKGILVYTDNSLIDPWLVSQIIVQSTKTLSPLVAIQPVYMHPYSVAKMVTSFGYLFHRRLYLNMVAGGFKNDLMALNDTTPHDKRYTRLIEYAAIINKLLSSPGPVTFHGEFYRIDQLRITPSLPANLLPEIFVSGSSDAGLDAATKLGATAVKYPRPASECAAEPVGSGFKSGIRVGIIARETEDEAWEVAEQRFPEDRKGELTHLLAMKVSDSLWHKQLSDTANKTRAARTTYWLRPFEQYKTFCPYLVGSYEPVAEELSRYISLGYRTFILDIPPNEEELRHASAVFDQATEKLGLLA